MRANLCADLDFLRFISLVYLDRVVISLDGLCLCKIALMVRSVKPNLLRLAQ